MTARVVTAVACAIIVAAASVAAQTPRLTFVRDTVLDLDAEGVRRTSTILVDKTGRIIVAPFYGEVTVFDSSWRKTQWPLQIARGANRQIGSLNAWGFTGDSLWIVDNHLQQVALVDTRGQVVKSVAFPSWIRPFWRDRRRYPLFSNMTFEALYADGTLLAVPSGQRRLLDTPQFDRSRKIIARVDQDGRILRVVASVPLMDGRIQLRSGSDRRWFPVPNYARTFWEASADGERIVVVTPLPSDSGAFRVTALTSQGDTAFSRRFTVPATRVAKAAADSFFAGVKPLGRYSAAQIKDTIALHMADFNSPVAGLHIGVDHSIWIWIRRPDLDIRSAEWMILDRDGVPQGTTVLPRQLKIYAVSTTRVWTMETDRARQASKVVLYKRTPLTNVRPARSARTSAPPAQASPRE